MKRFVNSNDYIQNNDYIQKILNLLRFIVDKSLSILYNEYII